VSQIKKYLPSEKKPTSIMGLSQIPKQPSTSKVESSPARKSSLSRLTASVIDKVLGNSNAKTVKAEREGSDRGSTSGVNYTGTMDAARVADTQEERGGTL
jgi:hypothetical protein